MDPIYKFVRVEVKKTGKTGEQNGRVNNGKVMTNDPNVVLDLNLIPTTQFFFRYNQ